MSKIKIFGTVLVALAVNSACSTGPDVKFSQISSDVELSAKSDRVEVFVTKNPKKEYKEIGILETTKYSSNFEYREIIETLKLEAQKIGADGIIVMDGTGVTTTNYITGQSYNGQTYRVMAIAFE